jgi:hypothetical protein
MLNWLKPQAYLDPGSGSILLQVILAALLAAGVFIKVFWKKITSLFNRKSNNNIDSSDDLE